MVGGMTTGDGGGSYMILDSGAGSREGVRMGGRGTVAPVTSWGLGALVMNGKCQRRGPVLSHQPERIGWPSGW
jgi:hypothetical protein